MDVPGNVMQWLLEGDPAVRWQVLRDLCDAPEGEWRAEQARVADEGWGAYILGLQAADGSWSGGLYNPKWTSTFYTLLLLRDLGLPAGHGAGRRAAELLLDRGFFARDGGLNYTESWKTSETCVTGMGLAMIARYSDGDERVHRLAEHLLVEQMADGGWNCQSRRGATHASFHTTISVLEGLQEYAGRYGKAEPIVAAMDRGREFLLVHRLFQSHTSGEVVSNAMKRLHFPAHWHYDVLRGLDHFREAGAERDGRLGDAIELVRGRRRPEGWWRTAAGYAATKKYDLEPAGQPGRMVTLKCLRVLRWWEGGQPAAT